ncbi:hypothetical protein LCGC14_0358700 [marine sediment metagenome]|uniref:Uncharacterized protein n=1 Tax=marine sediment metagenome TaxID=412755 RepID=A0A0F9T8P8_9ZZZZ
MAKETKTEETKIAKQVLLKQGLLETVRDPFVDLWKTCTSLGYPARNDWEGTAQTGRDTETDVYDDTCIKALNIRTDGLYGYHVSPAIKWFRSRMALKDLDELDEMRQWLQEVDEGMYFAYSGSNFYDASCIGSFLRDGDGVGMATMFPEEIIGERKIGFMVPHPREIWLADDKYGKAILLHRKFKWTTLQIKEALEESEIKKLSIGLQEDIKNDKNMTTKWEFIWVIWPNPDFIKGSLVQGRRKYNTHFVQVDGENLIRTSSLDRFPPVYRVKKPSNLPYGRGLIGEALISIGVANEMTNTMLGAAQLNATPPWMIPESKRAEADLAPDGRNYYRTTEDEIRTVEIRSRYPFGAEERREFRQAVMDNFQVDYFIALSRAAQENSNLRELHVVEIKGEKAALMGAGLGTLNTVLDEINDFVFDIEMSAGRLPQPPQVLLDKLLEEGEGGKAGVIDIDYIGPLAQAQKRLFKTEGILHSLDAVKPLVDLQIAAQQPVTALDRLKVEETVEEIFDANGMPQHLMNSDDEVEEIQQARAAAQQAREQAELALEMAKVTPGLGKTVEEGSPMEAISEAAE